MEYFIKTHGHGAGSIIIPLETFSIFKFVKCPFSGYEGKILDIIEAQKALDPKWGFYQGQPNDTWLNQTVKEGSCWTYHGHVVFVKQVSKNHSFLMDYVDEPGNGFFLGFSEFFKRCQRYYPYGAWINSKQWVAIVKKPINLAAEKIPGQLNYQQVEDIEDFPSKWKEVNIQIGDVLISKNTYEQYIVNNINDEGTIIDIRSPGSIINNVELTSILLSFKKVN